MDKKVFTAGTVLRAADVNTYLTSSRNYLLNADFNINQRAFTSTTTNGAYGFDRWKLAASGGCTYSTQAFTPGAAPVSGYEAARFARLVTTGQSGTSVFSILQQSIEDVRTLAGETAVISFWAKADSGTPSVAIEIEQEFGSGGSPSTGVKTAVGKVAISTVWARYSLTVSVPSITGKTIGTTANTSYMNVNLWVSAGTDFNARTTSLGIQSNTFDIWGVQIEEGSTPTPFSRATPTIASELAACQRYFFQNTNPLYFAQVNYWGGTAFYAVFQYPVQMRVTPTTVSTSAVSTFSVLGNGANTVCSTATFVGNSPFGAYVNGSCAGGNTAQAGTLFGNTAAAFFSFSAEF